MVVGFARHGGTQTARNGTIRTERCSLPLSQTRRLVLTTTVQHTGSAALDGLHETLLFTFVPETTTRLRPRDRPSLVGIRKTRVLYPGGTVARVSGSLHRKVYLFCIDCFRLTAPYISCVTLPDRALDPHAEKNAPEQHEKYKTAVLVEALAETALESSLIVGFVAAAEYLTGRFVTAKFTEVARLVVWTAAVFLSGAATAGPRRWLDNSQLFNIDTPIAEDW